MSDQTKLDADCMKLHTCYQQMTGNTVSFIGRHFVWADFIRRGLTIDDLKRWLNDLKYRVQKGQLDHTSLRFSNAISNLERCEEGCVELRRRARGTVVDTDKSSVLRTTGRTETTNTDSTRTIADIIPKVASDPEAARRAFEDLQRLRQSL